MTSAWNCLYFATLELVHSAPIKQRIINAYRGHLKLIPEEQLPLEIRESFAQVMRNLGGVQPLRGEDAVAASVRKMSGHEADECATAIVEMFEQLCRSHVIQTRPAGAVVMLHPVESTQQDLDIPALIAHA
jgi:hypothetical protein